MGPASPLTERWLAAGDVGCTSVALADPTKEKAQAFLAHVASPCPGTLSRRVGEAFSFVSGDLNWLVQAAVAGLGGQETALAAVRERCEAHLRQEPGDSPPGDLDAIVDAITGIALTPPATPPDPPRLARLLTTALLGPGDPVAPLFREDGSPLPAIFVGAPPAVHLVRVELTTAAVRAMLASRVALETEQWTKAHPEEFLKAISVTTCLDAHLRRYIDNPIDLLQNHERLQDADVPQWYDRVLTQSAIEATAACFDASMTEALNDQAKKDHCQVQADATFEGDKGIYGGVLKKVGANCFDRLQGCCD